MGNCTVAIRRKHSGRTNGFSTIVDINLSASYATGGDTVPLAALGLGMGRLTSLMLQSGVSSPGGHALEVVNGATEDVAPKIRARDVASGAELTNATDQSAQSIRAEAYFSALP